MLLSEIEAFKRAVDEFLCKDVGGTCTEGHQLINFTLLKNWKCDHCQQSLTIGDKIWGCSEC